MNQKIKILHTLPDLHFGGVANLLLKLLKEFNDPLFEHHLCYFGRNETLLTSFNKVNVKIHKIEYKGKFSLFNTIRDFNVLLKRCAIDVIHSHLILDRMISGLNSFFNKTPVVVTIHTTNKRSDHSSFKQRSKLYAEDFLGRLAVKQFIAITGVVRESSIQHRLVRKEKITKIHSGTHIGSTSLHDFNPNEVCRLISVGRLIENKGFSDLIEAMGIFKSKGEKFHLTILGDGPERENLQRQVRRLGLENSVKLVGFTSKVDEFLDESHIFSSASKEEGFSISTIEAMARYLPVVTYDLPLFKELSNDGEYFLMAKLKDVVSLSNKILEISHDRETYEKFSKKCFYRVKKSFNIERTAKEYLRLYENII